MRATDASAGPASDWDFLRVNKLTIPITPVTLLLHAEPLVIISFSNYIQNPFKSSGLNPQPNEPHPSL